MALEIDVSPVSVCGEASTSYGPNSAELGRRKFPMGRYWEKLFVDPEPGAPEKSGVSRHQRFAEVTA